MPISESFCAMKPASPVTGHFPSPLFGMASILGVLVSASITQAAIVNPLVYYTFENTAPGLYTTTRPDVCAVSPSTVSSHCLKFSSYQSNYEIKANGPSGNYLVNGFLGAGIPTSKLVLGNNSSDLSTQGSLTVEFLMKPDSRFMDSQLIGSQFATDNFVLRVSFPNLVFITNARNASGAIVNDTFTIPLTGVGLGDYSTLFDGNWHHWTLRYSGNTTGNATKSVCIDGQCPSAWQKSIAQSTFAVGKQVPTIGNASAAYVVPNIAIDQLAIYGTAISDSLVLQHYQNFQAGLAYNFNDTQIPVPAPAPVTNAVYDLNEFAPGTNLPTPLAPRTDGTYGDYVVVPSAMPDALTQLQSFPAPRYTSGSQFPYLYNWMDTTYMAGMIQPGAPSIYTLGPKVASFEKELSTTFHYGTTLSTDASGGTYNHQNNNYNFYKLQAINDPATAQAPVNFVTFAEQLYQDQTKPTSCYLQNASGSFLDANAAVSSSKVIRRTSSATNSICPDTQWDAPGNNIKNNILSILPYVQSKNVNIINENGEKIGTSSTNLASGSAIQVDPVVQAGFASSGIADYRDYESSWLSRLEGRMGSLILSGATQNSKLAGAKFTHYSRDGNPDYGFRWPYMRSAQSTLNGQKYSTGDFYLQNPNEWWMASNGPDHGIAWFTRARPFELAQGDTYFSPFVSPGWSVSEEKNVRPGMWAGLLTVLSGLGAEWFYTGMFNNVKACTTCKQSIQAPQNWIWQATIPAYVQSALSRGESLYRNSSLMAGDLPYSTTNSASLVLPSYRFGTGDLNKVVVVRKHNSLNQYMIFSTIQRHTNFEMQRKEAPVSVTIDEIPLQFMTRLQGSIHVLDMTVNPPTFKLLNPEMEYKHPSYWSRDFALEAELPDAMPSGATLRTYGTNGNDFRSAYSILGFSAGTQAQYSFTPRLDPANPAQTSRSYSVYIKARTTGGSSQASFSLDGGPVLQTVQINSPILSWCRVETTGATPLVNVNFGSNPSFAPHSLGVSAADSNLEVDALLLTENPNTIPTPYAGPCASPLSVPMDTQAPSVAIASPANGAILARNTVHLVTATASDNVGVTKVEFYRNNVLQKTILGAFSSYVWSWKPTATGSRTITIKAYDAAGNVGSRQITVKIQ